MRVVTTVTVVPRYIVETTVAVTVVAVIVVVVLQVVVTVVVAVGVVVVAVGIGQKHLVAGSHVSYKASLVEGPVKIILVRGPQHDEGRKYYNLECNHYHQLISLPC